MAPSGWKVGQNPEPDATQTATGGQGSAQVSRKQRPCRACDGRGLNHAGNYYEVTPADICAACDGSGRIEERIPASDAIADAETLQRWGTFSDDFVDASGFGACVVRGINDMEDGCGCFVCRRYIYNDALEAARSAFNAVPGLRA